MYLKKRHVEIVKGGKHGYVTKEEEQSGRIQYTAELIKTREVTQGNQVQM